MTDDRLAVAARTIDAARAIVALAKHEGATKSYVVSKCLEFGFSMNEIGMATGLLVLRDVRLHHD